MGLINFLKEKFAKHREEKKKEREEREEASKQKLPIEDEKPAEEKAPETVKESSPLSEEKKEAEVIEKPTVSEVPPSEAESVESTPVEEEPAPEKESAPLPQEEKVESSESKKEEAPVSQVEEKPVVETPHSEAEQPESKPIEEKPVEEAKPELPQEEKVESSETKNSKPVEEKPVEEKKPESKAVKESEKDVMDKYVAGLDKSRMGFTDRIKRLASANKVVNREYFDALERILIEADVGVDLSLELIKETASGAAARKISDPNELNDLLIDKMFIGYANEGGSFSTDLKLAKDGPTIVFMCGVNGGGKTTTTAKLAKKYKDRGLKVLLVAADTFRTGAVEQLAYWAERVGVDIISRPGADPASLCFDAMKKAQAEKYDIVFIDTAGRLQNKKALMDELSKVVRVIRKIIPEAPHEALLVIDANTGQNGIDQAQVFRQSVPLTGIVITKMDGTSKGGIILSIRKQLTLPVRFIGLGEKMDDLEEFDLDKYLYGLLVGDEEE